MKKSHLKACFGGIITAIVCFSIVTTALAFSGKVIYNGMNVSVNGNSVFQKQDTLKLPSGQEVPSSILYVDEYGRGTTYLPIRWLTENLGIPFAWDSESGTLEIGKGYTMTDPDDFLQEIANEWLVNGDYPKNAKGETYGPESIANIVGHMPDLIAAATSNGEEGYIRKSELDEYRSMDNPQYNSIHVYDLDGNVIGEFLFEDE